MNAGKVFPVPSMRLFMVVRRNFLVWRKLLLPSIAALLIDPAVALLGIGLGIGTLVGNVGDIPYAVFVASGMAAYSVTMTASFEALYSAFTRMHIQRTWESILLAPITLDDVFLGELIWAALKGCISSVAMMMVVIVFGLVPPYAIVTVLPFVLLGALAIASMALCMNALGHSYDFFSYYFSLFLTPMIMLSGIFFPRENLPAPLFHISEWLPMTQLLYLARPLAMGEAPEVVLSPIAYLVTVTVVFTLVAYRLTHRRLVI